ncbi:uncharacterized protein PGTG_15344 [Puccinia graminis f. sp. tritici CRL 75-36-700-3]|uniref:Uncharacterized protein n=1 Tax=Puccinia graminis f. sp. tritici (strain CRL 75-36-700-3 / race SCCL) TaxID=418459 RepID=E3KYV6_PUCGT|nr:uncharacterized protein PGTG_15344 [Puccinia graminis f. sp. tritici CRL 75-36-700-3]EFP89502.2 hypothetical protein PGTG_15344 [Puccinia graminis f. sp. tritici CRL 75-36-700-3]
MTWAMSLFTQVLIRLSRHNLLVSEAPGASGEVNDYNCAGVNVFVEGHPGD